MLSLEEGMAAVAAAVGIEIAKIVRIIYLEHEEKKKRNKNHDESPKEKKR